MLLVRRRFPRLSPTDHLPATWIRPLLDSCSTFHSSSRVSRISGTARFTFPTRARISSRILSMRVIRCLSEIRCRSIILAQKDEPTPDYAQKDEPTPDYADTGFPTLDFPRE